MNHDGKGGDGSVVALPPDSGVRPGMLVTLRRRMWRVEDVAGGVLTASAIDDFGARPQRFALHLEKVTPGGMPEPALTSMGDLALQQLFLQAVRLDALHGTAPFVSVQRTGVIPAEYQLVPLVMALRQRSARLLIADTTGLGKTIEAGLIVKELLARGQARSVLVLTPASLREQWRQQMKDLFYLDFEVMSGETRKRLERSIPPGADPWLYFDRLIVSIDYAKDSRIRSEILKRPWDIVVVDEAHNAAMPHQHQGRKADMDRWDIVDRIASRPENRHLLLLTATPHNGYTDSFCSLLKMLSPDIVTGDGASVRPHRERARNHVCQRTRADIQDWFRTAGKTFPFPEREPENETEVAVTLEPAYIKVLAEMDDVLNLVLEHARVAKRQRPVEWLRLHLHRRALSSPEALRISLENRLERLRQASEPEEDATEERDEEQLLISLGDQGAQDSEPEEEQDRRADAASLRIDQLIQVEYFGNVLARLKTLKTKNDRKLARLRDDVIPSLLGRGDDRTPARIILFTRYKDTLTYLERELGRGQKSDYQVITMHGDLSQEARDERFRAFSQADRAVLLATDVISEGLNLQGVAAMVIHYDIPWNPNRLEQRVGRVDRFGQTAPKVYVRTLYCRDTTDEQVMELLVRKLETIRRDLGACPPFFASEDTVQRLVMRRRRRTAAAEGPSLFEQPEMPTGEEDSAFFRAAVDRIRKEGFYGQTDVKIGDVSERMNAAHERFGSPAQVRRFVERGLRRYGCSVTPAGDGLYRIDILQPRLQVSGVPKTLEKAVLDPALRQEHPDAVVLDVGHPLVRRLNAVIREDALKLSAAGARTAAFVARGQTSTVLLGHGLLRAVAKTSPPTLLEEVVLFGLRAGLDGKAVLGPADSLAVFEQPLADEQPDRERSLERMRRLAADPLWQQAREDAIRAAGESLQAHRSKMRADLAASEDGAGWLEGFDDIETVGFDLYCMTLVLPERR